MRLCETKKLVPIFDSADINAGADSDSICVKGAEHVTLLCMFGPSLSGNAVLTLYEGASDGAKTSAVTFAYRYGGAATGSASSDVLSTEATSAALTCTGTTFVSRLLVIEVDCASLTDGYDWLTLQVGSEASAGELTVVAVLDSKYQSPALDTVLS
jgi:hypothetical protein